MSAQPTEADRDASLERFWKRLARMPAPSQCRLSPELLREILEPIAWLGCHPETAAGMVGVPVVTWNRWRARGKRDQANSVDSIYAELERGIVAAFDHAVAEQLGIIRDDDAWTSKAWLRERVEPQKYGQRRDVQVTHRALPMIDPDLLSVDELEMLYALLRKGSPDPNAQGLSKERRPVLELMPADVVEDAVLEAPAPKATSEKPGP